MKLLRLGVLTLLVFLLAACSQTEVPELEAQGKTQGSIQVNVLLNRNVTPKLLADLGTFGTVHNVIEKIDAVMMQVKASDLAKVKALPYVKAANPDAKRYYGPVDTVALEDFSEGLSTWNLDAVNVTDFSWPPYPGERTVSYDGSGVYVAVLDTGLVKNWRQYFPEERIAEEYAISFGGGGGERGNVSEQPNKWEHDINSHGTHVTSTIIGYNLRGTPINGVAPMATVIPVKVLNQPGFGWSSVVAAGITYIGDLKAGPLKNSPVVINMSLGGPVLDAVEQAAIDYALSKGVIIVASAGNSGVAGMGYPGAYAPVISVAAYGWAAWDSVEGCPLAWWLCNVDDPTDPEDFFMASFSSRQLSGQDLDVSAPGQYVVGPYQLQQGKTSFYYLSGTSMASPHVAGIVALMAEKDSTISASQAEDILEDTAIPMGAGCRDVKSPFTGQVSEICWGADATGHGLATADAALAATP